MSNLMEKYLVRIENISGHGVGAGFLINKMEVATCAHVVSTALGFGGSISFEAPQDEIHLTFPFIQKDVQLQAHVACWDHANDIAILRLKRVPPAAAESACFSGIKIYEMRNHPVRMYGFPEGYNDGVWSNDWKIKDSVADNLVQLESDRSTGKPIGCGFSGAPVFNEQLNQVVGMISATDSNLERKVAFMIPAEAIVRLWPVLLGKANMKLSRHKREIEDKYLLRKTLERIKRRDEMIKNCTEFNPYGLMEVIRILDMRLLGNFDNMPWNEAIQIVREELEKRRASYHDTEIEHIRKNLRTAIEDGIDPHDIKILKNQLGEVLLKKEEAERGLFSSSQFLKLAISQESREQIPNSSGYITSHIIS